MRILNLYESRVTPGGDEKKKGTRSEQGDRAFYSRGYKVLKEAEFAL